MTEYMDSDAAANAIFWSGQARMVRAAESNRRAMYGTKRMWVEVVAGKQKGAQGVVFWVGESKFGPGYRVGLETEDGQTVWAAYSQVELMGDWNWDGENWVQVEREAAAA